MPYSSVEQAKGAGFNTTLDGVALTLAQVNEIARQYDAIKKEGGVESPMAVAVASFKKSHIKTADGWRAKTNESTEGITNYWYETSDAGAVTVLEEAAPDGAKVPRLTVTVLREGFSTNYHKEFETRRHRYLRYYTAQSVADMAEGINGKSAYVGSPVDHDAPRTLRDSVVGVFENGRVEDDNGRKVARADIKVYPDQTWIVDRARVNPQAFGPSMESNGNVRRGVMKGRDAAIIENITEIGGALLVENPAAGGALDRILESQLQHKHRRGEKKMFKELTEAEQVEVMTEARKLVLEEAEIKAKDVKIKELEEANKKLQDEQKAVAAKLTEAKSRELLEAAFPKDLPDVSKTRLYESCKGETDPVKITEAVKNEAAYVAAVSGGTVVTGAPGMPPEPKTKLNEAAANTELAKEGLGLVPRPEKK